MREKCTFPQKSLIESTYNKLIIYVEAALIFATCFDAAVFVQESLENMLIISTKSVILISHKFAKRGFIYESYRDSKANRGIWYNRTKVEKTA